MAGSTKKKLLTVEMERFIRLEAEGMTGPEIAEEIYGAERGTPLWHSLEQKFSRWRHHPRYAEIWKDQVDKKLTRLMAKSIKKLDTQIDNTNDWLANKASNDIVNLAKTRIYADEDRTIHVQIGTGIELGKPESD